MDLYHVYLRQHLLGINDVKTGKYGRIYLAYMLEKETKKKQKSRNPSFLSVICSAD